MHATLYLKNQPVCGVFPHFLTGSLGSGGRTGQGAVSVYNIQYIPMDDGRTPGRGGGGGYL